MISFRCPHCGLETSVDPNYAEMSGPCAGCGRIVTIPSDAADASDNRIDGSNRRRRSSWYRTLVALGSVALGLAVLGWTAMWISRPIIHAARVRAQQTGCSAQLRQILSALHAYHAEHDQLPEPFTRDRNGQPLHSWRVAILPYLGPEARALYQQIDHHKPWNSPNNMRFHAFAPAVFRCPSDEPFAAGDTSYCVVSGDGFAFDPQRQNSLAEIQDPLPHTLLVVEVARSQINWMQPKDVSATALAQGLNTNTATIASLHENGTIFGGFADGNVHPITDCDARTLKQLATIRGGEPARLQAGNR